MMLYFIAAGMVRWRGVSFIHRILPPVVIGPVVMVIGLGFAQVAISMATDKAGNTQVIPYGTALSVASISLLATMLAAIHARGLLKLIPILVGVLAVLLNLILPPGETEEEIKPAAFP